MNHTGTAKSITAEFCGNLMDIVYWNMNCPARDKTSNKKLVFVVDLSGSMRKSIPALKNSLLSFRDTILDYDPENSTIDSKVLDARLKDAIDISIIGFSNTAWDIYPVGDTTWDAAVDSIKAHKCTNMGAGILRAYEQASSTKVNWIVVMTDGISNVGDHQTLESFDKLRAPPLTRVITLGYGSSFDVDILTTVGDFTYIRDQEFIPVVFGSLAEEILESWGFNGELTVLNAAKEVVCLEEVIGKSEIGCLYTQRKYGVGYKCNANKPYKWVQLSYINISTLQTVKECSSIEPLENVPEEVYSRYYSTKKGLMMKKIYQTLENCRELSPVLEAIKKEIGKWNHPTSVEHKEEILQFVKRIENCPANIDLGCIGQSMMSRSCDAGRQSSMTCHKEQTPSQQNRVRHIMGSYGSRK